MTERTDDTRSLGSRRCSPRRHTLRSVKNRYRSTRSRTSATCPGAAAEHDHGRQCGARETPRAQADFCVGVVAGTLSRSAGSWAGDWRSAILAGPRLPAAESSHRDRTIVGGRGASECPRHGTRSRSICGRKPEGGRPLARSPGQIADLPRADIRLSGCSANYRGGHGREKDHAATYMIDCGDACTGDPQRSDSESSRSWLRKASGAAPVHCSGFVKRTLPLGLQDGQLASGAVARFARGVWCRPEALTVRQDGLRRRGDARRSPEGLRGPGGRLRARRTALPPRSPGRLCTTIGRNPLPHEQRPTAAISRGRSVFRSTSGDVPRGTSDGSGRVVPDRLLRELRVRPPEVEPRR